jgi:hypothetical protein
MCVQRTVIKGYKFFHYYQILPLCYTFFRSIATYIFCQSFIHIDVLSFITSLDGSSHFHLRRLYGAVSFPNFMVACQLRTVPPYHRADFNGTTTCSSIYRVPEHRSCSAHKSCIRRNILGQLLCSGTQQRDTLI